MIPQRFKSYLINEAKAKRGEKTPLAPNDKSILYCLVELSIDLQKTKKGIYRFMGAKKNSNGYSIQIAEMINLKGKQRKEGRISVIDVTNEALKAAEVIRRISTFNNADALERGVIFAAEFFFEHQRNPNIEELKEIVDNYENPRVTEGFRQSIYDNSIRSITEVKKIISPSKTYSYERQGENYTKILYKLAKKYNKGLKADNWNPGDIWLFSQNGISKLNTIDTFIDNYVNSLKINHNIFESDRMNEHALALNYFIAQGIQSKDIIPISLKKPTHNGALKAFLINKFDPANLPEVEDLGELSVTAFTGGSLSFRSFEIQTDHYKKLALKFQVTDSADTSTTFQHRVRNNLAGHAEGSYLSTTEWKNYLANNNIKLYGTQPGYRTIPEGKAAMKKLFLEMLNVIMTNPKLTSKAKKSMLKMGDPEVWFETFYNTNKTNNMLYIKRLIFIGSWHKAYLENGDDLVKTAMTIAMKGDHDRAGSAPHYIIK